MGRDPANAIPVVDPSVSRKHCLLRREDGRFQIKDLESRNGTLVNGLAVKEQWLRHGDEIAIGDSVFLFLLEDGERAAPSSRVEFDDARPTETRLIQAKDAIYLQPDRLLRELPARSPISRNLSALFKISRIVHAIRDLEELQAQLLDLIFGVVPASRGAILLTEGGTQEFSSLYARTRQPGAQLVRVSRTIAQQVMKENVAILGVDVPGSGKLREVESLAASEVHSLLCVPLTVFQRVIGCIYVDSSRQHKRQQPLPRRSPATDGGGSGDFRRCARQCPAAAVAGTGKPAAYDRSHTGSQSGGRRRPHERDLSISDAGRTDGIHCTD